MKKKLMTLLMSAVMALGISASAFAAPVGVVNVNAVLNSYPGITEIAKSVAQEKTRLQEEFNKQSANMSDADKQALAESSASSWQTLNRRRWLLYKEKSTKLFLT